MSEPTYRIKPLEWSRRPKMRCVRATALRLCYDVYDNSVWNKVAPWKWSVRTAGEWPEATGECVTQDEAMAACEQHYRTRLAEVLEAVS